MGNKFNKAKNSLSEKFDLPREIILDLPKITVTGDSEINIENHKGIKLFSEELVKVNSNCGVIGISGSNFEILFMGGSTLVLSGKFKSIIYEGEMND